MRALLVLLLCGTTLLAAPPEAPLGTYVRLGVPVLLKSDGPVSIAGWHFESGLVHPPRLSCTVVGADGDLALQPVPEGSLLVGVAGPIPLPNEPGVLSVAIDIDASTPWRALDVFDRIIWLEPGMTAGVQSTLLVWIRMGGDLVISPNLWPGEPADLGLGRLHRVRDYAQAPPPGAHPVPRIGNIAPEVYDAGPGRGEGSPALAQARLVFGAIALVALLLVVGGAGGWISRTTMLRSALCVALLGSALGAWRTRAAYEPFAEATLEVVYRPAGKSEFVRVRTFRLFKALGAGAEMALPPGTPFFYLRAGEPWWGKDGRMRVPEAVQRGFFDDVLARGLASPKAGEKVERRLRRRVAPPDAKTRCWSWIDAFRPVGAGAPPFLRIEVVAVR